MKFEGFNCPFSQEEIKEIYNNRLLAIDDWIAKRYPRISLAVLEQNLPLFEEIKRYDDACQICVSTQMCPTLDGNRMSGKLMPDGNLTVWMHRCPKGYRLPRAEPVEESSGWRKRQ